MTDPSPDTNTRSVPAPRHRKKQSDVTIVGGMRSSPAPPLTSGSSSPSVTSVETGSTGLGLGLFGQVVSAPVINSDRNSSAGDGARSRSSSWSRTPSTDAPNERLYTCLFHMLDCHDSFDDVLHWKTHVLSHFRTHPAPRMARCPLCSSGVFVDEGEESLSPSIALEGEPSEGSTKDADADSAWVRMLDHVAATHYQRGETLAGSRPDFELMRYLYGRRIISDAQFKAMQLAPAPSSPAYHRSQDGVRASIGSSDEPYCAPYSKRREERMRGATRGVSVV